MYKRPSILLLEPRWEVKFTREGRRAILNKMVEAEGFEKFLHVKYMGTKRFGLDGGESLIPAMEQIIKRGGSLGIKEIVFGMPHRGRLSVLANVLLPHVRVRAHPFCGAHARAAVPGCDVGRARCSRGGGLRHHLSRGEKYSAPPVDEVPWVAC